MRRSGLIERTTGRALRAINLPGWENVPVADVVRGCTGLPFCSSAMRAFKHSARSTSAPARGARSVLYMMLVDEGVRRRARRGRPARRRPQRRGGGNRPHERRRPDGLPCDCGLRGCLEPHVKLSRLLQRIPALDPTSRITDFSTMIRAARDGHAASRQVLTEAADSWPARSAAR
jgi:hypothetical protein